MEGSLCKVNRYVDQAPEQVQDSRYSQVLLSGQGETPGQTVPLSVEAFHGHNRRQLLAPVT